ncbi:hypothetical protein B0H10DRAFT_417444 [Mycena sp. CBHHK59/15]|nr:hypothetical protein B0H10DRAFT_417444 [Mycena sp. CBHHK59/15]
MEMTAAELRTRLDEVCAAIAHQKLILEELEANRKNIQRQLDSLVVYPILTLPVEITSQIFIHSLPAEDAQPSTCNAPLLLLEICRAWRQIAISTPSLWATLNLDMCELDASFWDVKQFQRCIYGWLDRARGNPLFVSLREWVNPDDERFIVTQGRLEFISRFAHHLQSLKLHVSEDHLDDISSRLTFPLLRKLSLGLPIALNPEGHSLMVEVFEKAPKLRELHLSGEIKPNLISLPWDQLLIFRGDDFYVYEGLEVLRLAPNLVECTLSDLVYYYLNDDHEAVQPVVHSCLRSLTLIEGSNAILRFLTLPALQSLRLSAEEAIKSKRIRDFLSRSSPPLRTFAASITRFGHYGDRCFALMPALEDMELWWNNEDLESEIQSEIQQLLPAREPSRLPLLRHLTLHLPEAVCRNLVTSLSESNPTNTELSSVQRFQKTLELVEEEVTLYLPRMLAGGMDIYVNETRTKNHKTL